MTHNTNEFELQLKHPIGVSLARAISYVNQTKLLRYPHNSTTRRNQNHTNPYMTHNTKEVELQLKNTTIKNSTSLKENQIQRRINITIIHIKA